MILGFAGAAGVGKTTFARKMEQMRLNCCVMSFASPIKSMIRTLLSEVGINGKDIMDLVGTQEGKATEIDLLDGHTVRYLLQTLGTEWGRKYVHNDMWTNIAIAKATSFRLSGYIVIIDDVRFDNEAAAIEKANGSIVYIERPGAEKVCSDEHASENSFTVETRYERLINDGNLSSIGGKITNSKFGSQFSWL
mgnify:CR=1 FL=1